MLKWDFKSVKGGSFGKVTLGELSPEQVKSIGIYDCVLTAAMNSDVANPKFSKYFCKEGVSRWGAPVSKAGNIEYGFCQALHGEESVVGAFRASCDRNSGHETIVLGIIDEESGMPAAPCGNCRDIMLDDLGANLEIISGPSKGGLAVVTGFKDFLFDSFKDWAGFNEGADKRYSPGADKGAIFHFFNQVMQVTDMVKLGRRLENDPYSPKGLSPGRKYYALIATGKNKFYGAHHLMCDYHPVYAVERAVIKALDEQKDPFIKYAIILTENDSEDSGGFKPPHVMYRDRQHLYELNLYQELILKKEVDPPVYLVTCNNRPGQKVLGRVWRTSVKEWLPFPFSARHFGAEFIEFLTKHQEERQ